jgi:putative membrane protein
MMSLAGLPAFLLYLATAAGLTGLYLAIYTLATAHNELALIRRDVTAASVALGGSLVGFGLPLSAAISQAGSLLDCLVWGLVALMVQIAIYWLVRLAVPDLSRRIAEDRIAAAVLLGAASVAGGLLNAAAMTE